MPLICLPWQASRNKGDLWGDRLSGCFTIWIIKSLAASNARRFLSRGHLRRI